MQCLRVCECAMCTKPDDPAAATARSADIAVR